MIAVMISSESDRVRQPRTRLRRTSRSREQYSRNQRLRWACHRVNGPDEPRLREV